MRKQILFRVPEETYNAALILAKEAGLTFNGLVNQALRLYLQQEALKRFTCMVAEKEFENLEEKEDQHNGDGSCDVQ